MRHLRARLLSGRTHGCNFVDRSLAEQAAKSRFNSSRAVGGKLLASQRFAPTGRSGTRSLQALAGSNGFVPFSMAMKAIRRPEPFMPFTSSKTPLDLAAH